MNYNYTEEHYAEMYNNLPEGLKDLVLSGRLAIQVSAIGNRHGLNADQVADLEPAVEDVCLGLVLKQQLADNIKTQVGVDDRVSNRIAAEVEIEILRPFEPELIIARQQKEDLDKKIANPKTTGASLTPSAQSGTGQTSPQGGTIPTPAESTKKEFEPKDVSGKSNVTAIKNFYSNSNSPTAEKKGFDWDNFGAQATPEKTESNNPPQNNDTEIKTTTSMSVDEKIDKLTDTINKLVVDRFGGEKKDDGLSEQMKELIRRLEIAEKENQENKKIIQSMQANRQLETITNSLPLNKVAVPAPEPKQETGNKIVVDKPRSVAIDKTQIEKTYTDQTTGNIKVGATSSNLIPIHSSTVSMSTADTIVETRNKQETIAPVHTAPKAVLSLDELLAKNDSKIQAAKPTTAQVSFPTIGTEKKIDIKNIAQVDGLRQTLLDDLNFLKTKNGQSQNMTTKVSTAKKTATTDTTNATDDTSIDTTDTDNEENTKNQTAKNPQEELEKLTSMQTSVTLNQFKDELIPKTKEDRMKALQDKIKAMNKGVSTGGANSIAASALDPYKL